MSFLIDDWTVTPMGTFGSQTAVPINSKNWTRYGDNNTSVFTYTGDGTLTVNATKNFSVFWNAVSASDYLDFSSSTLVEFTASVAPSSVSFRLQRSNFSSVTITGSSATPGKVTFDISSMGTRNAIRSLQFSSTSGATDTTYGAGGAEPHIVCLDGSRLEVYHDGVYRLFEDPVAKFLVNMRVENTYIADIAAIDENGVVVAEVHYDVDTNRQLHANHLVARKASSGAVRFCEKEGQKSVPVTTGTTAKDFTIVSKSGYTLTLQSRYRSFSLQHDAWERKKEVRVGGALVGDIKLVQSMEDATPIPLAHDATVQLCKWDAHALACDAHFPHIVSFFGDQVIPGEGEHTLLSLLSSSFEIKARTDAFSRLEWLTVTAGASEPSLRAEWSRQIASGEEAPAQDTLPVTVLRVMGEEFADATRVVDHIFSLGEGEEAMELLVRFQANGAASFAMRASTAGNNNLHFDGFEGILVQQSDRHKKKQAPLRQAPGGSAASTATTTASVYEKHVEPHLAWRRGESTSSEQPATALGGISVR
jgi:hypothetical protein